MTFYLMHKNIPVAEISQDGSEVMKIFHPDHYPVGAGLRENPNVRGTYLKSWLKRRGIPKDRQHLKRIREIYGQNVDKAAIRAMQVSLTDCYWIRSSSSPLTWEDVNYHDNGFSSKYYKAFISKIEHPQSIDMTNFPDVTTNGMQEKVWTNGKVPALLKHGIEHEGNGGDVYGANECIASQIAKMTEIPFVQYYPVKVKNVVMAICPCIITDPNHELITALDIKKENNIVRGKDLYAFIRDMGYGKEQADMVWFDHLIRNTDRHEGNIFFIRDADTLEIKGFSPLLDNGTCLAIQLVPKGTKEMIEVKPYCRDRYEQLALLTDEEKSSHILPPLESIRNVIRDAYDKFHISKQIEEASIGIIEETYSELAAFLPKEAVGKRIKKRKKH